MYNLVHVEVYGRFFALGVLVQIDEVEPQRVEHHAYARKAHRARGNHRIERDVYRVEGQHARRNRYANDVVYERPEQVFFDVEKGAPRKGDGFYHVRKARLHKHYVRAVYGDVRACADCYADVRAREGGRVVDSVADHNDFAVLFEGRYHAVFVLRQYVGNDRVYVTLVCNGFCAERVVAREHNHAQTLLFEGGNCLRAVGFYLVRNRNHARYFAVESEVKRRFALLRKCVCNVLRLVRKQGILTH